MAEHLLRNMLSRREHSNIEVLSRGLDVKHSSASYYAMKVMKEEYGIDLANHVPRELTKAEGDTADLILTMSCEQKERAIYYGWAKPDRIFTLGEYVGEGENSDIKDPYAGKEEFLATAKKIEQYLGKLIDRILPAK
jgi:protein-tyrosine-phosphatase